MKKTTIFLGLCACFLIYSLLRYPAEMVAASLESIQLWLTKVFPSLFPFMAACGILLQTDLCGHMSRFFHPLMKCCFGLGGIAAIPFFLGILSGYPVGAKTTAQLYEKKYISLAEAQHILVFSNHPSPLFLIGTVGTGFFGLPFLGYLFLLSSCVGAVISGVLWRFCRKKQSTKYSAIPFSAKDTPLTEILSNSVSDALHTMLLIGGYLILFGALSEALKQTDCFLKLSNLLFFLPISADTLHGFFCGLLEMTNGAYLLSQSPGNLRLRLTMVMFLVAFGGLSILGQTLGVLSAVPISKKDYLKGKLFHALCSSLFFFVTYPYFCPKAQKAVPVFSLFTETAFTLSFLWLLPSLFFLSVLCHAVAHRK